MNKYGKFIFNKYRIKVFSYLLNTVQTLSFPNKISVFYKMSRLVKLLHVGKMNYQKCLDLQNLIRKKVKNKEDVDTIIIVEHDPVYTVGIREKQYSEEEERQLKELGAEFYRIDRGGLITFHGPGQLVAYPILDLRNYNLNVRCYVKRLEDTIIDLCKKFSLNAETSPHTGVWVNDMKICAIGIHVSHHVTTHGLALNCNVDLNWFSHIIPCGIQGKAVTSLSQQLQSDVSIEETLPIFIESFGKYFSSNLVHTDKEKMTKILKKLEKSVLS